MLTEEEVHLVSEVRYYSINQPLLEFPSLPADIVLTERDNGYFEIKWLALTEADTSVFDRIQQGSVIISSRSSEEDAKEITLIAIVNDFRKEVSGGGSALYTVVFREVRVYAPLDCRIILLTVGAKRLEFKDHFCVRDRLDEKILAYKILAREMRAPAAQPRAAVSPPAGQPSPLFFWWPGASILRRGPGWTHNHLNQPILDQPRKVTVKGPAASAAVDAVAAVPVAVETAVPVQAVPAPPSPPRPMPPMAPSPPVPIEVDQDLLALVAVAKQRKDQEKVVESRLLEALKELWQPAGLGGPATVLSQSLVGPDPIGPWKLDVETSDCLPQFIFTPLGRFIIELKHVKKAHHALGQVLAYTNARATQDPPQIKTPYVHLFGDDPYWEKNCAMIEALYRKYDVYVVYEYGVGPNGELERTVEFPDPSNPARFSGGKERVVQGPSRDGGVKIEKCALCKVYCHGTSKLTEHIVSIP